MNTQELATDVAAARAAQVPDNVIMEVVKHYERLRPGAVAALAMELGPSFPDGSGPTFRENLARRVEAVAIPAGERMATSPRPGGLHPAMTSPAEYFARTPQGRVSEALRRVAPIRPDPSERRPF